jgi:hypothetical protein
VALTAPLATPALAHTEATIDNPQAGATNITLTLNAEAESDTAGIKGLEVVLPEGITPDQVSLATAPSGWKLASTAQGFTIAGTTLPVGTDAKASLRLEQLPAAATVLAFKTLVNYSDGQVDRWIEVRTSGGPEVKDPAPTVSLKAASAGAVLPATSPTAAPATNAQAAPIADTSANSGPTDWIIGGAVLFVVVAGLLLWRRRVSNQRPTPSGQ